MKRYAFSIVMTILIVVALALCVILFQKETKEKNDAYLIEMTEFYYG